jgi:Na+/proline symporter
MRHTIYFWLAFLIYSFAVIWIGLRVYFKEKKLVPEKNNKRFWHTGKNLSAWSVGFSISASMMSVSWSGVYGVQLFYWYGIGGAWLLAIPWLLAMAGFYFFAPFFRKTGAFSQPQLLAQRFGAKSKVLLAPVLIFVFTVWTGAEIYAAGLIITPFLKIPLIWTLALITLVVAVYSFSGGFEAVISTDKIQYALISLFLIVIAFLAVSHLPDNANLLNAVKPPKQGENPHLFSPGIALILLTLFAYLPGWLIETDVWIRLQAAKSDKAAQNGTLLAAVNSTIFVGVLPMIIGLSALVLFPPVDGNTPEILQDGTLVFTIIMKQYAPLWLNILLSVGLIAAAMSTIDTCGNVVALSFSHDIIEPIYQHKKKPKQLKKYAMFSSMGAIIISFVYAIFTESLWDVFYLSSGILTTTVFLPVAGVFLRNTVSRQIYLSIALGFSATILFYYLESRGFLRAYEPEWLINSGLGYILYGFIFSLTGFIGGKINFGGKPKFAAEMNKP